MTIKPLQILGILALVLVGGLLLSPLSPARPETTIGVLVPLTGSSAGIGERVKAGIEVGVAEINETGGNIRVVFEDDKGDATTAVSAARKLIDTDGVHVIIGTVKSDAMLAVAPITEEKQIILLSPTAGAAAISQAGDFVFRVIELPDVHGRTAAAHIGDVPTALFVANAANAQSYGKAFKDNFKGGIVHEVAYNQNDLDFRTDIAKSKGAEAFYLAVATAKDAGVLVKQIRESGFTGSIMASVAADAKEFFDAAGQHAEGTRITTSFFDPSTNAGAAFNARYKAATGNEGDGFAANGYDSIMLISKALGRCGSGDTACIRDFLYGTREYEGAGGTPSFDMNGDVEKPVTLKVARGGKFVLEN